MTLNFAPVAEEQAALVRDGETDEALSEASSFLRAWDIMAEGTRQQFALLRGEAA